MEPANPARMVRKYLGSEHAVIKHIEANEPVQPSTVLQILYSLPGTLFMDYDYADARVSSLKRRKIPPFAGHIRQRIAQTCLRAVIGNCQSNIFSTH